MSVLGLGLGTIIVSIILIAAVVPVVVYLIKSKKSGKSFGGCHGCPHFDYCSHKSIHGCSNNPHHHPDEKN